MASSVSHFIASTQLSVQRDQRDALEAAAVGLLNGRATITRPGRAS